MYKRINIYDFVDEFEAYGRKDEFTYDGLNTLFRHLDSLEDYELDVIAICCEFTEYSDIQEFNADYGTEFACYQDIEDSYIIPIDDKSFIIEM